MGGGRTGPFDNLAQAVVALRGLEAERNRPPLAGPLFGEVSDWPYGITIGTIEGGAWPASAPEALVAHARVGFGRDVEPHQVQEQIREAVAREAPGVEVGFEAFPARAHCHDLTHPWPQLVAEAHGAVVGGAPAATVVAATTDAPVPGARLPLIRPAGGRPARHRRVGRPALAGAGGRGDRARRGPLAREPRRRGLTCEDAACSTCSRSPACARR
jgi:hypothetical protein